MRANVYLKTLDDLRGQTLAWSAGLVILAAANVLLYPTVQSFPGLISFLDNMPPAFKAMVGDVRTMAELEGFLRVKLFDPLPLLLAIFAVSQGALLIAGEIEMKSIDLLLARPIPRWRVVVEKFLALVTATAVMTAVMAVGVIVCVRFVETDITADYVFRSAANGLPLTWVFGAMALLGSCLLPRPRHAAMAAGTVVVASYTFETLRLLAPVLRRWDEISLFAHQKASLSLAGKITWAPVALLLGLAAVLAVVAMLGFARRDLSDS